MIERRPWLLAALVVAAVVCAACTLRVDRRPVNPDLDLLERSWSAYKARFITFEGRVIRPENDDDTVSEGQAYAMLRAVWMDDRAAFDRVLRWTRAHLSRPGRPLPALMAWHWGTVGGGHVIDWNAATDADSDLALALILAADVWPGPGGEDRIRHLADARAILRDLFELTAVDETGHRVLLAGEWADQRADGRGLVLNPSYFAPASYRVFARVTGDARWLDLARGSYLVLETVCRASQASIGTSDWRGLVPPVPDWVRWTSPTRWAPEGGGSPSWDAVRIPWRVGTDYLWSRALDAERFMTACLTPVAQARLALAERAAAPSSVRTGFFAFSGGDAELASADHPLTNAMFAFSMPDPSARTRLIALLGDGPFFGDGNRYYVNSLAYLPFLMRAGRYRAPANAPSQLPE